MTTLPRTAAQDWLLFAASERVLGSTAQADRLVARVQTQREQAEHLRRAAELPQIITELAAVKRERDLSIAERLAVE